MVPVGDAGTLGLLLDPASEPAGRPGTIAFGSDGDRLWTFVGEAPEQAARGFKGYTKFTP
jgi:hypothetical protein